MNEISFKNSSSRLQVILFLFVVFLFLSCTSQKPESEKKMMATLAEPASSSDTMIVISDEAIVTDSAAVKNKKLNKPATVNPKPQKTPPKPTSVPKTMSAPPKSSAPPPSKSGSYPGSENEGMGTPPGGGGMELIPEAPMGIRNPVGPPDRATKKPKPKTK